MVGIKLEQGWGWRNFCKINNVVTMLNDINDFCCLDLQCSVVVVLFYVEFPLNMFEFICDPPHGHRIQHLHTITYYLLYSSINYNYCFGNKSSRFFEGQTDFQ